MPAQADDNTFPFFVYRGSLRSGQQLYRHEHIIEIMGDVNPGAQVASNGDILIWGRLRGLAHAGVEGNLNAIIAALDLTLCNCGLAQSWLRDSRASRSSQGKPQPMAHAGAPHAPPIAARNCPSCQWPPAD